MIKHQTGLNILFRYKELYKQLNIELYCILLVITNHKNHFILIYVGLEEFNKP